MDDIIKPIQDYIQAAIDNITGNLSSMTDSKGRNRFASGVTAQNVGSVEPLYKVVVGDKQTVIEVYMPPYYDFIDKGVNGYKNMQGSPYNFKLNNPPIPLAPIREFMRSRGIVPRDKGGKRVKLSNPEKQLNSIAYAIGRGIKMNGIEGVPYYSSVINDQWIDGLRLQFANVYGDAIVKGWDVIFKPAQVVT
jgi:hypothetical protein